MLYIRHAQKAYSNGADREFSLDPSLTEVGRTAARDKFRELIRDYGIPTRIVCSPYLRARETAQIATEVLFEMTNIQMNVSCNPEIGEYLGHHKGKDINSCLRKETLIHNPVPPELWKDYITRINKYVRRTNWNNTKELVWHITHGLVIQSIAHFKGVKIKHPEELSGICVVANSVSPI